MGIGNSSRASESRASKDRYSELARLLRDRREELGLSRRDVVARTQLSYPYVSQLEGGYRAPSVGSARKLADALHLPVEDVVRAAGGDASEPQTPPSPPRSPSRAGEFRNPAYSVGIMHDARAGTPAGLTEPDPGPNGAALHEGTDAERTPRRTEHHLAANEDPRNVVANARHVMGSAFAATAAVPRSRGSDLETVADDVGRLLRRLPPEGRLDALALVQSRLMAEMVQEQVRRATES